MKISVNTTIDSSAERVWQAITDFENCPSWIAGILSLEVLEQPESGLIGFKWRETREMFGKEATETMWITDCVDGEYYQTRAENHGAVYVSKLMVQQQGEQTLLTMEFSGTSESFWVNLLSSVMSVFMKKSMFKMIAQDLADIKAYVEASAVE